MTSAPACASSLVSMASGRADGPPVGQRACSPTPSSGASPASSTSTRRSSAAATAPIRGGIEGRIASLRVSDSLPSPLACRSAPELRNCSRPGRG
eukprot:15456381-Alexandrium_andersonii.AAC.1